MQKADLIIIGGGPGGYETAAEAAASGLDVILFEKGHLGGTCLNRGCIPTKCLCAGAEILETIRNSSRFGIEATATASYASAVERAAVVIGELRCGIADMLGAVRVINAEARLAEGPRVIAAGEEYTAQRIIIATGSCPATLRGIDPSLYHSSDDFLSLTELPRHITVVGGGVIGLEMASVAAAYGSDVTVLEFCKEILPGMDADIAKRLRNALGKRGISIVTDARVTGIDANSTVRYTKKDKEFTVESDYVLAAVGRRPALPDGCKEAGIAINERGFIATDDSFRTSVPGIYAIGDVNGKCMLAHAASAQGRCVLGQTVNLDVVPSVVFTIPECAFVKRAVDCETRAVKLPYASNGKALASGQDGLLKLECEAESGILTACSVLGPHAADLVAEAALAISKNITARELCKSIHAHPTLSELLPGAAAALCR